MTNIKNLSLGVDSDVGEAVPRSPVFHKPKFGLGEFVSPYRSRTVSGSSSSSSHNSTGTVCESEIFPYGRGIRPQQRKKPSGSPPERGARSKVERPPELEEDTQSVSTVSGSGIDFFRKFVQRKGASCRDCEDQFRREVLIDRLVSDSLNTKASIMSGRSSRATSGSQQSERTDVSDNSSCSLSHSLIVSSLGQHGDCPGELEQRARGCSSRCKTHRHTAQTSGPSGEDLTSISSKSSLSRSSSISGSGLLFLRNYLKKKKSKSRASNSDCQTSKTDAKNISAFNIVPVPFPPPSDFYGPAFLPDAGTDQDLSDASSDRRLSVCSTVADLLNEDFDCDDSELKNLDWEEWDEPLPDELSYDDLVSVISESFYSEDMDLSELCEIDWEGRKTVVATDRQVISPDETQKECSFITKNSKYLFRVEC